MALTETARSVPALSRGALRRASTLDAVRRLDLVAIGVRVIASVAIGLGKLHRGRRRHIGRGAVHLPTKKANTIEARMTQVGSFRFGSGGT